MNEHFQLIKDARRTELLDKSHERRQEAIAAFILNCAGAAYELRQMCDARRCASHPIDHLEDAARFVAQQIASEFRFQFGRPLFE